MQPQCLDKLQSHQNVYFREERIHAITLSAPMTTGFLVKVKKVEFPWLDLPSIIRFIQTDHVWLKPAGLLHCLAGLTI